MAQRRVQVDSTGLTPVVEQPVAAPVDTYGGPGDAGVALGQLAQSLSGLSPELSKLSQTLYQREATEEEKRGTLDAIKAQGTTLAAAVRAGKLPASGSPFYMAGLKEQYGRVAADQWQAKLIADLKGRTDLQESVDPEQALQAFNGFAADSMNDFLKSQAPSGSNDQAFQMGFNNRAQAYLQDVRRQYLEQLNQRVQKVSSDLQFAEVHKHLIESLANGAPEDAIVSEVNSLTDNLIKNQGRDGTATMHATVDAFVAAALDDPDHSHQILDMVSKLKGGSGLLRDDRYAVTQVAKARQEAVQRAMQADSWAQRLDEREKAKRTADVMGQALDVVIKDPTNAAALTALAQQVKDDPGAVKNLVELRNAAVSLSNTDDIPTKNALQLGIWSEHPTTTINAIMAQLGAKHLTGNTALWLVNQIKQRDDVEGSGSVPHDLEKQFEAERANMKPKFRNSIFGMPRDMAEKFGNADAMFRQWFVGAVQAGQVPKDPRQIPVWLHEMAQHFTDQQLGPDEKSMTMEAPPPPQYEFNPEEIQKRLPTKQVLSRKELDDLLNGVRSDNFNRWVNKLGIASSQQAIGAFVRSQQEMLIEAHPAKGKRK